MRCRVDRAHPRDVDPFKEGKGSRRRTLRRQVSAFSSP
jgi:hypothetical protein